MDGDERTSPTAAARGSVRAAVLCDTCFDLIDVVVGAGEPIDAVGPALPCAFCGHPASVHVRLGPPSTAVLIEVDRRDGLVSITVVGGLDETAARTLAEELVRTAGSEGRAVVDLTQAVFVGRAAASAFVQAAVDAGLGGIGVVVSPGGLGVADFARARTLGWIVGTDAATVAAAVGSAAPREFRAQAD